MPGIPNKLQAPQSPLRAAISAAHRMDEAQCVAHLLKEAKLSQDMNARISAQTRDLVATVRKQRLQKGGIDAFLCEYDLSTDEGIALMCLAEALLRVPDKTTIDRLIRDKLTSADWQAHRGKSDSWLVNMTTWALMLTGKIYTQEQIETKSKNLGGLLSRFIERSSEPVVRKAIAHAVKILSRQFVMGQTIEEALQRAKPYEKRGYAYSYDMLGEAARTQADADAYFTAYQHAINALATSVKNSELPLTQRPGISVKLSALHPRYEISQYQRVLDEIVPKLFSLAVHAKEAGISLTVDAEESDRLDLSLDIIDAVFSDPALDGWEGFGLAVQAYQKRAWYVLDWLSDLAKRNKRRLMIRLIKGAYWDTEIKIAQERGLDGYPVFTRKASTDVSYLACARKILQHLDVFYPQFATHNAHSVATLLELMGDNRNFEFQCLHGMGYTLYDQLVGPEHAGIVCRIYAPVGGHEQLLSYLVRRLLENGANSSFVNRIIDANTPIDDLTVDPVDKVDQYAQKPHPHIPLPAHIYGSTRLNSRGYDFSNLPVLQHFSHQLLEGFEKPWQVGPIICGEEHNQTGLPVSSPTHRELYIGKVLLATPEQVEQALDAATKAFPTWSHTPAETRARYLEHAADLFEKHGMELMALLVREGGKTWNDAVAELREAVDFCRYYAEQARKLFTHPIQLPGPTGESDQLSLHGRGVAACISPWNFPLAIFIGQVAACLAAGNTVIAKPAAQTPLVAGLAIRLLHTAGIPGDVVQLLPGRGAVVGEALVNDPRISLILFTGSTETAWMINQKLAARKTAIVPFIAETGGQNAMIVDSSALPEQIVQDVITSAFTSAGQRCSALRVLFVQEDIADKLLTMLSGAMKELRIGDPACFNTDVGPVIDQSAKDTLEKHAQRMMQEAKLVYQMELPIDCPPGSYFAPRVFEIGALSQLTEEVFGPILHVVRYSADKLDDVIASINQTGYGLTLGIHSRIVQTVDYIVQRVHVGNIYVNRNMIGAVVGVQPFGGEGLSGTGPKAGGPHYLLRLCTERTLCINTTASGGNASLMSLGDED